MKYNRTLVNTWYFTKFTYVWVYIRLRLKQRNNGACKKVYFPVYFYICVLHEGRMVAPPGYSFASAFPLSNVFSNCIAEFHPFPGLLFGQFVTEDKKKYGLMWTADVAAYKIQHTATYNKKKFQRKKTCNPYQGKTGCPILHFQDSIVLIVWYMLQPICINGLLTYLLKTG